MCKLFKYPTAKENNRKDIKQWPVVTSEEVKRDWPQEWEIVVQRKVHVEIDELLYYLYLFH